VVFIVVSVQVEVPGLGHHVTVGVQRAERGPVAALREAVPQPHPDRALAWGALPLPIDTLLPLPPRTVSFPSVMRPLKVTATRSSERDAVLPRFGE
jgi:hypothetical protein